jgi:guanylate kinase
MLTVVEQYPEAVTIFIEPESLEQLERQLRGRGTESEQSIERRLEVARREMALANRFRHRIINRSVEQAVDEIEQILNRLET